MTESHKRETDRRRTFGIISHPDAGKTTLTEQLLLLGGAIRLAGDVRARKTARYAASDWMAIEKERGISVASSVMKFTYADRELNLLDTPGHQDFSEDTYRALTAVDSALMVIDSAKGVEQQTRKLMEVCRLRDTPILTFINKLDLEGREPLDLLSDIEEHLEIEAVPVTWPIGVGGRFRGTYHVLDRVVSVYPPHSRDRVGGRIPLENLGESWLDDEFGDLAETLRFEVSLVAEAGGTFNREAYRAGRQTPVVFGSAISGFGVDDLLNTFVAIAPGPQPRQTTTREVSPYEDEFSGIVFKIQANMDPNHRDRIAFVRVCSGRFVRGMKLRHHRRGQDLRVANATIFLAQDRNRADEAFPGDIIGIPNHGTLRIGDTLTEREPLQFTGIPSFAPEHFRRARTTNALRAKQLEKGLYHLIEEGAIQLFRPLWNNDYVLGAIGPLQFDVVARRLETEYGVDVMLDPLPFQSARWVEAPDDERERRFIGAETSNLARDVDGTLVYLAESAWRMDRTLRDWPGLSFRSTREHMVGLGAAAA